MKAMTEKDETEILLQKGTRKRGQVLNLGISDFLKSTGVIHKKVGPVHESKSMEHTIELQIQCES